MEELRPQSIYLSLKIPSDIELEQAILGALLSNNYLIPEADKIINHTCFFEELHAKIFKKITDEFYKHGVVDTVIITSYAFNALRLRDDLEQCREEINNMLLMGMPISDIRPSAQRLRDLYKARAFLESLSSVAAEFSSLQEREDEGLSIDGIISQGERKIIESRPNTGDTCQRISDLIPRWKEQRLTFQGRKLNKGLMTGYQALDDCLKGLKRSQLIILAGRTSMGKTAFALNILANICENLGAENDKGGVALFSLEMSNNELISRFVSMVSGKDLSTINSFALNSKDTPRISTAANYLQKFNVILDDYQDLTFSDLRSRCLRLVKKENVRCVCIDYLQLMKAEPGSSSAYRTGFITQLTAKLKALAKELDIPIIVLSQLSRAPESRAARRPELADLRDSGTIEQDADVVLFLYRPKYYELLRNRVENTDPEYEEWSRQLEEARYEASILVAKNRNGPIGDIDLKFIPENVKFENLEVKSDCRYGQNVV